MTKDFKELIEQIRKDTTDYDRELMTQHVLHALLEATEGRTLYREQYDEVVEIIACYVIMAVRKDKIYPNEP